MKHLLKVSMFVMACCFIATGSHSQAGLGRVHYRIFGKSLDGCIFKEAQEPRVVTVPPFSAVNVNDGLFFQKCGDVHPCCLETMSQAEFAFWNIPGRFPVSELNAPLMVYWSISGGESRFVAFFRCKSCDPPSGGDVPSKLSVTAIDISDPSAPLPMECIVRESVPPTILATCQGDRNPFEIDLAGAVSIVAVDKLSTVPDRYFLGWYDNNGVLTTDQPTLEIAGNDHGGAAFALYGIRPKSPCEQGQGLVFPCLDRPIGSDIELDKTFLRELDRLWDPCGILPMPCPPCCGRPQLDPYQRELEPEVYDALPTKLQLRYHPIYVRTLCTMTIDCSKDMSEARSILLKATAARPYEFLLINNISGTILDRAILLKDNSRQLRIDKKIVRTFGVANLGLLILPNKEAYEVEPREVTIAVSALTK